MRLIDADSFVLDSIKDKRFVFHTDAITNDAIIVKTIYGDLLEAIANMPTIDAVPVVRCKDCRHWDKKRSTPSGSRFCFCTMMHTHESHYCGYGRKKD